MTKNKEVTIQTVANGGYIVLEKPDKASSQYGSSSAPQVAAAFTNFEDLSKGLVEVFGVDRGDLDVGYLRNKMSG